MKDTPFNLRPRRRKQAAKFALLLAATFAALSSGFAASLGMYVSLAARSGPHYKPGTGTYNSWAGIDETKDPESNTIFSYEPDGALGHLSYRIQGTQSLYDPNTEKFFTGGGIASSNWENGTLGALVGSIGDAVNQVSVTLTDNITFTNTTGQPQPVTIRFVIHGGMSAGGMYANDGVTRLYYGRASATATLIFAGNGGQGGKVDGLFGVDSDPGSPQNNYGGISPGGWDQPNQTFEITMDPGGKSGTFTGTFILPAGERTYEILQKIFLDVRYVAEANYANTAGLQIVVPTGVSFTSESGKLLTSGARMVNIATRAKVLGGDSVAIGGFIITGSVPKKVIIRGIGPSLSGLGVPGALTDPTLELLQGNTSLATNDNWKDSQQTEIQNSGVPPGNNLESAIVRTLDPGSYTAILRGKNNGTGVGLIEVYDLDTAADSKLANISTRAFVEAGDNVLIGGIIGGGNGSQPKVLIRAIGPSLTPLGVANALQDPVLELHDKDGALLVTNDNWESDQKAAIQATGIQPSNPNESAILATLLPTNYTAIVKGANNTSGVGLVEVYHLQ
ncbi:MAG TPA: hypothetical protein VM940_08615 [Chthoniobacterales bacterium]|jgi:hypothetical protein|nr:hypothetical protein [Chthoniobacterales bacterium]